MILIISNKWDVTVDFVIRELRNANHNYLRINTEDFINGKVTITLPELHIYISKNSQIYDLTETVCVIWYRRPGKPFDDIPKGERPSLAQQRFINDQWYSWIEGLQLIPNVTWINHPAKNDVMENKIRQLHLAALIGFKIPSTIISNDPIRAKNHISQFNGKTIAKALYAPLIEEEEQDYFVFTNLIDTDDIDNPEEVQVLPVIFQQALIPKVDYRVTVIGDHVLTAKIEFAEGNNRALDWRTQKEGVDFHQTTLPQEIENLCREYVKECDLIFGALDLVEHNNKFYFLEINPNGEWGWLQKPYGLPIAKTFTNYMISKDK